MGLIRKVVVTGAWVLAFAIGTFAGYFVLTFVLIAWSEPGAPVGGVDLDQMVSAVWVLYPSVYFAAFLAFVLGVAGKLPFTRMRHGDGGKASLPRRLMPLLLAICAVPALNLRNSTRGRWQERRPGTDNQ